MNLTDLPTDVILLILPYLTAKEFLAFTSCTRSLVCYKQDSRFWRELTRSTFRIPPQPLLEADGARWQRLYKTLRTQTHVYTWGSNAHGNLGHFRQRGPRQMHSTRTTGIPKEMVETAPVGVVADVQCGGWSTVLLNSIGQLWAVGAANAMMGQSTQPVLSPLKFPNGYPATTSSRYDPSTAIRQYSVGRCKVLALSDDYKIWEWDDLRHPGQFIKFFNLETGTSNVGKVKQVVAGWSKASAYVTGAGIVYWKEEAQYDEGAATDGLLVEHRTVPGTAYRRDQPNEVHHDSVDISIGEVVNYIFLDEFIVFTTHLNKLFAWKADEEFLPDIYPMELSSFYSETGSSILDIQGSFQKFGIFTTDGVVMIGSKEMLDAQWNEYPEVQATHDPEIPFALQNSQVVSLAFGDYHFHALHANGTITSYGRESQGCGALGLGGPNVSSLRGTFFTRRTTGDGQLRVPSWGDGRRTVWFEAEKARWISDTCQKEATSEASPRAARLRADVETAKLVGEWFEREGRDWSAGPVGHLAKKANGKTDIDNPKNEEEVGEDDDDDIDAYFALKVAAAGWSSAALVLVNGAKAERVRRKYLVSEGRRTPRASTRDAAASGPSSTSANFPLPSRTNPPDQPGSPGVGSVLSSLGRSAYDLMSGIFSPSGATSSRPTVPAAPGANPVPGPTAPPIHGGATGPATTPNPAAMAAAITPAPMFTPRRVSDFDNDVYVWEDQPFPRLRYPDGTEMPGEVPLTPWKGGEPDFASHAG